MGVGTQNDYFERKTQKRLSKNLFFGSISRIYFLEDRFLGGLFFGFMPSQTRAEVY